MMPIDDLYNMIRVSDAILTGGQPTEAQLIALAQEGFSAVINLAPMGPSHPLAHEAELVRGLGMTYHHIPVRWSEPTETDFEAFERTLLALLPGKVLIHCAANFRVTAFFSLYAQKQLGWSADQAEAFRARIWTGHDYPAWRAFLARMQALPISPVPLAAVCEAEPCMDPQKTPPASPHG